MEIVDLFIFLLLANIQGFIIGYYYSEYKFYKNFDANWQEEKNGD